MKYLLKHYIVIAQGRLKQSHPGAKISVIRSVLNFWMSFVEEVISLGETEENDYIDDGEGEHVTGDHREYHGYEGSSKTNGSGKDNYSYITRSRELPISPSKKHE